MPLARLSVLALVPLFLAACGAPPASGPDASLPDLPPLDAGAPRAGEYCEETAGFFCEFYLRCGRIVADSAAECRATFLESCNARYEQRYVDLEDAGLLVLSAAGMEACRVHLSSVSCELQHSDLVGPCAGMWVGTQPEGAACGVDVESFTCGPGTACVLGLDFCGTCKRLLAPGEACGDGGTCGPDAACVGGACVARSRVTEPCSPSQPCVVGASCTAGTCSGPTVVREGESCDQARRCPYRSACIGGSCVRAALLGEDCSGRTCASGRCVTEGAARVCRALLSPGEACSSSPECRSALCVGGTCHALPDACFP